MVKVVENGERICTVTLDGSESSIVFQASYRYFAVKNESDADVYVSLNRNIVEGADGVMTIGSKESAVFPCMKPNVNMFFIKGKGKIQVIASSTPDNPFNYAPAASDGGVMASGNPVQIDGLQGGVPFSEMVVSGKNLLPVMSNSVTRNGITYTVNADGTITLNGTAEKADGVDVVYKMTIKAGVYTLSGCPEGGSGTSYALRAGLGTANTLYGRDYGNGLKITVETDTVITVTIQNAEIGRVFDNVVFRPQLEYGDTATEYEPPITGRDLTVNVCGKNLLQKMVDKTIGGLHYSPNDDGSVSVTGTQTAENYPGITSTSGMLLKTGNYTLSGGTERLQITALDIDANTVIARAKIAPATFSIDTDKYIRIYVYSAGTYNSQTFDDVIYPQLELGSTATPYEPYHGSTTTITPDTNPYTIPNDIRQVDGLNNISVSEGKISVTGVRKNAAVKRIWDEIGDVNTVLETVTGGVS